MATGVIPDDGCVVYLPARPDGEGGLALEVRWLSDGRPLGMAFSSIVKLVEVLGPFQPWVSLPVDVLRRTLGQAGVMLTAFDPWLPADAWRHDESSVQRLARGVR